MSFDTKCYDLAVTFLPAEASQDQRDKLAQVIQDVIEVFLEAEGVEQH